MFDLKPKFCENFSNFRLNFLAKSSQILATLQNLSGCLGAIINFWFFFGVILFKISSSSPSWVLAMVTKNSLNLG